MKEIKKGLTWRSLAWRKGYQQGIEEERERIEKILIEKILMDNITIQTLEQKKELDWI